MGCVNLALKGIADEVDPQGFLAPFLYDLRAAVQHPNWNRLFPTKANRPGGWTQSHGSGAFSGA